MVPISSLLSRSQPLAFTVYAVFFAHPFHPFDLLVHDDIFESQKKSRCLFPDLFPSLLFRSRDAPLPLFLTPATSPPGTLSSPSSSRHSPLAFRWELHSTSGPLMDDEWPKGCECTESALLPSPFPPAFLPLPSCLAVSVHESEQERGREREDRRERPLRGAPSLRLDT